MCRIAKQLVRYGDTMCMLGSRLVLVRVTLVLVRITLVLVRITVSCIRVSSMTTTSVRVGVSSLVFVVLGCVRVRAARELTLDFDLQAFAGNNRAYGITF